MAMSRLLWCLTGGEPKRRILKRSGARFLGPSLYLSGAGRGGFALGCKVPAPALPADPAALKKILGRKLQPRVAYV